MLDKMCICLVKKTLVSLIQVFIQVILARIILLNTCQEYIVFVLKYKIQIMTQYFVIITKSLEFEDF